MRNQAAGCRKPERQKRFGEDGIPCLPANGYTDGHGKNAIKLEYK